MESILLPPSPGCVAVGSLSQAKRHKRRYDAMITLEDPRARPADRLRFTNKPAPDQLVLAFEDVDSTDLGLAVATEAQVAQALAFAARFEQGSLLVHCFHGVGRSAAIALAILSVRLGNEDDALDHLLDQRPAATPNLAVLAHADRLLGTRLVETVTASESLRGIGHKRETRRQFAISNRNLFAPE